MEVLKARVSETVSLAPSTSLFRISNPVDELAAVPHEVVPEVTEPADQAPKPVPPFWPAKEKVPEG